MLDIAEAWGTAPWELVGGSRLKWYLRFMARRHETLAYERKMSKRHA